MPNRSLTYAKLVQGESRTSNKFECYAEAQPNLCKVSVFN